MQFSCIAFGGAVAAAALVGASPAAAAAYHDVGDTASFSFGGGFTLADGAPGLVPGDALDLGVLDGAYDPAQVFTATEEFEGLVGSLPNGDGMLEVVLAAGAPNIGVAWTLDFDRSGIFDVADGNALGAEIGTLTFTISEVLYASVAESSSAAQLVFDMSGLLSVTASSYYDGPVEALWSLTGGVGIGATAGFYTMVVELPAPQPPAVIPAPGAATLLLSAAAALALRRRL